MDPMKKVSKSMLYSIALAREARLNPKARERPEGIWGLKGHDNHSCDSRSCSYRRRSLFAQCE
jgi:hypothetical protein